MKRSRNLAVSPRKPAGSPRRLADSRPSAEILVPIEGGGSVSVRGKTAEIRDPEGRVLVRFEDGAAEIVAPSGDLRLSAPEGRVVLESGREVVLSRRALLEREAEGIAAFRGRQRAAFATERAAWEAAGELVRTEAA